MSVLPIRRSHQFLLMHAAVLGTYSILTPRITEIPFSKFKIQAITYAAGIAIQALWLSYPRWFPKRNWVEPAIFIGSVAALGYASSLPEFSDLAAGMTFALLSVAQVAIHHLAKKIPPSGQVIEHFRGGRGKAKKEIYQKDGVDYYTHADGHESKHLDGSFTINEKCKSNVRRAFIKNTKKGDVPATFFPSFAKKYYELLRPTVIRWVENGADFNKPYVEFSKPVGADEGKETNYVQIYFTGELGVHMRPKTLRSGII